jgi:flagellar biosynthesis protein FliR
VPPFTEHILARVLPIGLRAGGLMTFAPFLGSEALPVRVKAIFTIVLTAILYGVTPIPETPLTAASWVRVAASEAFVGLMMGLVVQLVFEGVQLAGQLAGIQFGFSLASLIDPLTNIETPVLSVFYQTFALLIFLQLNVHHWLLRTMVKSFEYLPVGSGVATASVANELFRAAGAMWLIGVQIAAPVVLATMLVDMTVGFLSKASPQLPAMFIGISAKSLIGYGVVAASAALWPSLLERDFTRAMGWAERLLHLASSG